VEVKEGTEIMVEDIREGNKRVVHGVVIKTYGKEIAGYQYFSIVLDTGYRGVFKQFGKTRKEE